jgi:hypothetical protein
MRLPRHSVSAEQAQAERAARRLKTASNEGRVMRWQVMRKLQREVGSRKSEQLNGRRNE